MATYPPTILTAQGQTLYGKVQTGIALNYTRFQIGSGQLQSSSTLSSALVSGTAYTSLTVPPLTGAIASGSTIIIGTGSTTQTVTASAEAAIGATSIPVTSFSANAAYAVGTSISITQNPASLTSLITTIAYFNINSISDTSGTANIRGIYQNTDLTSSTYTCEIGLFAQDPDVGEILYAYANAGANGDTIPPYSDGPFSRQYTVNTAIGNATNVTATIPSDTYVLASSVAADNGVASLDATGNVPSSQLGNVPPVTSSAIETALGYTPLSTTGTAANSNELGGNPPSYYLPATAQAVDSANLGGIAATSYIRGDSGAPNPQTVENGVQFKSDTWLNEGFTPSSTTELDVYLDGNNGSPGTGANQQAYWWARVAQKGFGDSAKTDLALAVYDGTSFYFPLAFDYTNKQVSIGNGWSTKADAISATSASFVGSQIFTSSGTFMVPAGVKRVYAQLWAPGGGGGGYYIYGGTAYGGQGGGAGGFSAGWVQVSPDQTLAVNIGAGGGGAGENGTGASGGTTTFAGLQATGGRGGSSGGGTSQGQGGTANGLSIPSQSGYGWTSGTVATGGKGGDAPLYGVQGIGVGQGGTGSTGTAAASNGGVGAGGGGAGCDINTPVYFNGAAGGNGYVILSW